MNKVKERKRLSFWKLYLIYVIILAAGVLAAVLYVPLKQYFAGNDLKK